MLMRTAREMKSEIKRNFKQIVEEFVQKVVCTLIIYDILF